MSGFLSAVARGLERPAETVRPGTTSRIREEILASRTQAGRTVTIETALGVDAYWACIRCLSDAVGALPLKTYRKARNGRIELDGTPVHDLLGSAPNPEMTAVDCWSLSVVHLCSWGNSYLGKEKLGADVIALWPIRPDLVRVSRRDGRKLFQLRDADTLRLGDRFWTSDDIIHVKGMSLDGLVGLAPVSYMRETIGRALAQDEFANRFFANGAVPRGTLEMDGELDDDSFTRLERRWNAAHRGSPNAFKVAFLEAGMKFNPITMPLDDAQFIEQEKMTVQRMARIFRIPPSMIGGDSGESLKYHTVEGDGIHFERYSVNPWLVRLEQALNGDPDLFPTGRGRQPSYSEFFRPALLRSDSKTRAEVWEKALSPQTGWMRREEVREAENLPPEDRAPVVSAGQVQDQMAAILAASMNGGAHVHN